MSVYRRDASWHLNGRGGNAYAYHWPSDTAPGMARCQPRFTMLDDERPYDPVRVDEGARCGRPGCRQKWAAWVRDHGGVA
jgi:hypothetical protein